MGLVTGSLIDRAQLRPFFGSVLKEKRLKTAQKMQFFKICFILIQNWKTHETNVYSAILGGCWREKVVSVYGLGRSKSHFWAPEHGHFWPKSLKVAMFRRPKMRLRAPQTKNGYHFFTPTSPQNGGIDICFMRLPLLGELLANFENSPFFSRFSL